MNQQERLLKDVVSEISGEGSEKIVDLLNGKRNVNEFLIAKKMNLTINQTRNILYKLGDAGLVSFIRKKDSKKGGWYTYFWTLNSGKAIELLRAKIFSKMENMQKEIEKRHKGRFYYSPDVGIEYTEEQALEHDFIDPESGSVLELKDNSEAIKKMEDQIIEIKSLLDKVNGELGEIEKKEGKSKQRKIKAEEKKKSEERAKRRKMLAKERAKKKELEGKGKKKEVKKSSKKVLRKGKKKISKK